MSQRYLVSPRRGGRQNNRPQGSSSRDTPSYCKSRSTMVRFWWILGITMILVVYGLYRTSVDTETIQRLLQQQTSAFGPYYIHHCTTNNKSLLVEEENKRANNTTIPGTLGVDPIYVELYKEAEIRSEQDFQTSHRLGERGIVIGPTEGDFDRYTLKALRNGRRIRNVLGQKETRYNKDIKVALMTSVEHSSILLKCSTATDDGDKTKTKTTTTTSEACRLWDNGTLFDHVITTPTEPQYKYNDNNTNLQQGSSKYWLKALGGYARAPYKHTLFIDSDSYPCPGVEKLFLLTDPVAARMNFDKQWQLPISAPADFAIGIEQFQVVRSHESWTPGDPNILSDHANFAMRNTGAVLFSFERQVAHTLAHFIPLVSEHVYTNVATPQHKVNNDQTPFRIALYLFHRFTASSLTNNFIEHQIPMHASCRNYPGIPEAGTDGFTNGMYPLQQDGKACSQCSCTPCLINHNAASWDVRIYGPYMGWEEDYPSFRQSRLRRFGFNTTHAAH